LGERKPFSAHSSSCSFPTRSPISGTELCAFAGGSTVMLSAFGSPRCSARSRTSSGSGTGPFRRREVGGTPAVPYLEGKHDVVMYSLTTTDLNTRGVTRG
jgi:hypothetical protein